MKYTRGHASVLAKQRVPRPNTKGWEKGRAGPFLKLPPAPWVSAMPPPNPEHTCRPPLTLTRWTCPICIRGWEPPRFDGSRKRSCTCGAGGVEGAPHHPRCAIVNP